MRIEWSQRARNDLRALRAYIASDSPVYACRFIERMLASVEMLDEHPDLGRRVPEAADAGDLRELIFQGYRLIYLRKPDAVVMVTVVHGSRDLGSQPGLID